MKKSVVIWFLFHLILVFSINRRTYKSLTHKQDYYVDNYDGSAYSNDETQNTITPVDDTVISYSDGSSDDQTPPDTSDTSSDSDLSPKNYELLNDDSIPDIDNYGLPYDGTVPL